MPRPASGWWAARRAAAVLFAVLLAGCAKPAPSAVRPAAIVPAPPARVELWLGGDVNLGAGGRGVLAPLAPLTRGAVGIVNLEGPVTPRAPSGEGLKLFNAPGALGELKALGVEVAGIANNHAGDVGPEGTSATARALREAGLVPVGGPAGVAVIERGGLRVAVTAHDLTDGVPPKLNDDLKAARAQGDVLVATFHVTGPDLYLPRPELRQAVELALAAGASVVAAHGTHAVGPVERRRNAVIAWGLGNVAFACDCTHEDDAVLLRARLEGRRVVEAEVLPIDAGLDGAVARPSSDAAGILGLIDSLGGTPLRRNAERGVF